ncbi:MAG: ankyrin repeat domain-containing protein [Thermoanaerobaculia bacterium]
MLQTMTELVRSIAAVEGAFGILLRLAVQGTAVVALAWVVSSLVRRRAAAVRHLVWTLSTVVLLVLPLAAKLPGVELPLLPPEAQSQTPSAASAASPDAVPVASTEERSLRSLSSQTADRKGGDEGVVVHRPLWDRYETVAGLLYISGMLFSLLPLAVGLLRVRRLARSATELAQEPMWAGLLASLTRRLGITRTVSLRRHGRLTVPVTWGWRRPVVLMPVEADEWPEAERCNALLHELAHVARGDWLLQLAARLACAVHWFNPLVWAAARRLAAEAERACDDRVLLGGTRGHDYADQLVVLARRARHGWAPGYAAIAMARPRDLARRVAALLDEATLRGVLRRRSVILSATAALLLTSVIAPARLVRAAAVVNDTQEPQRPKDYATGARPLAGPDATPLMRAAAVGDRAAVERLLVGGADPDRVVPRQGTALILAATAGAEDVVAALLEHGADPNLADPVGNRWANLPRTALNGASRAGCLACARLLLERGARIDATPQGDATPLMAAAQYGHLEVVRFLVDRGANVNARVRGDGTPLIEAAREGHSAIVDLLLERGAEPDVAVVGDGNPLIMAAAGGHLEIARTLLDAGADPNVWVSGDEGPLYHAVERSDREMVRLLLERGADPTQTWPGDGNALAVAGESGDREMLELLLSRALEGASDGATEGGTHGDPDVYVDADSEIDADVETEDWGPGAWLIVDGAKHQLTVPQGAVVEFDGTGRLEFPAGPVSVRLPAGHRLVVDREPMDGQAVITGDPAVRVVTADGRVAWRLRAVAWSVLDRPGTRIEDSDPTHRARIDTSGDRMRFYLAVDERGRETFFEPRQTSADERTESSRWGTGDREVILALTAVLGDENAFVRRAAVNSLMDLGVTREASVRRVLRPLLRDPDRDVQHAAEAALGLRERVRSNPVVGRRTTRAQTRPAAELLAALESADAKQRVAALDALGNVGDTRETDTVGPILPLLADANEIVRQRAAAALGNIGSPRAVDGLIAALRDADEHVRQEAGASLGAIGDARAVSALSAATRDRDEHVRQATVSALGQIGDPRAAPTVIAALKDPDEHVRQVAAGALGRLGR